jgi:hypothetical protein
MSITLESGSGLLSGSITFYDSSQAPLKAAKYQLTVNQTVDLGPEGDNPPDYEATQVLQVTAPQFNIEPSDLQSVFPPGNHAGNFAEVLPHVVLTQDLPWARPIVPGDIEDNTPWLALLVVHGSESGKVTGPSTLTVAELVNSANKTVVPSLGDLTPEELKQAVQVMKVDLKYFLSISPKLEDLNMLTHVRDVDTSGKVTGLANGFWSLVVANRMPASSKTSAQDNTVYLVSVEGHSQHLAGSAVTGDIINLAVLAQWRFTVSEFPGDFLSLLQNIKHTGQNQVLRMPSSITPGATVSDSTDAEQIAQEALGLGFVPTEAQLLEGEQTTAWVRGVLTPWPNRQDPLKTTYAISDHAIRYDPKNGLFDFSYAAAWQVGRLLALSDTTFVQQMQAWRQQQAKSHQATVEDQLIRAQFEFGNDDLDQPAAMRCKQRTAQLLQANFAQASIPQIRQRRSRACTNSAAHLPSAQQLKSATELGADPLELIMTHLGYVEGDKK